MVRSDIRETRSRGCSWSQLRVSGGVGGTRKKIVDVIGLIFPRLLMFARGIVVFDVFVSDLQMRISVRRSNHTVPKSKLLCPI